MILLFSGCLARKPQLQSPLLPLKIVKMVLSQGPFASPNKVMRRICLCTRQAEQARGGLISARLGRCAFRTARVDILQTSVRKVFLQTCFTESTSSVRPCRSRPTSQPSGAGAMQHFTCRQCPDTRPINSLTHPKQATITAMRTRWVAFFVLKWTSWRPTHMRFKSRLTSVTSHRASTMTIATAVDRAKRWQIRASTAPALPRSTPISPFTSISLSAQTLLASSTALLQFSLKMNR